MTEPHDHGVDEETETIILCEDCPVPTKPLNPHEHKMCEKMAKSRMGIGMPLGKFTCCLCHPHSFCPLTDKTDEVHQADAGVQN